MENNRLPPGPTIPKLFQLAAMIFSPERFLKHCHQKYGDWFVVNAIKNPLYLTTNLESIKQIFTTSPDILYAGVANRMALETVVGYNSLLTLDGSAHMRQRKLLLPPFHGERMQKYGETIRNIIQTAMRSWPQGKYFPILTEMHDVTLRVILTTIFGIEDSARYEQLRHLITDFGNMEKTRLLINMSSQAAILTFIKKYFIKRFYKLLAGIDKLLYQEIKHKRDNLSAKQEDILSLLLSARDEDNNLMTDSEIRDELMTLLIAGHDTSATALSWTIYHLLANPATYLKLKDEINSIPAEVENIVRAPYLEAVINESLRVTPVVNLVARVTQQPITIGEYTFPKGVILSPAINLVQHRADIWPNPNAYQPERFINQEIKPYSFFPFGGGVRRCIGMAFAMYEMKIILYEIVKSTELQLQPGYHPKVVRRGVVHIPKGGVPVKLAEKK